MRRFLNLLILIFGVMTFAPALAQTPAKTGGALPENFVLVSGFVMSLDSLKPVPFATIQHKKYRTGVLSQTNGFFAVYMEPADTLIVTAVGYETHYFTLSPAVKTAQVSRNIMLTPKTYELREVNVYAFKGAEQFKKDFVNLKLPGEKVVDVGLPALPKVSNLSFDAATMNPKYTISGPITALYNQFSKEGKELRRYQEVTAFHQARKTYEARMTPELVGKITGLQGQELARFMEFCQLSEVFVATAPEADLIFAINDRFQEFKRNQDKNQRL